MPKLDRAREFLRAFPLGLAEEIVPCRFGVAAFVRPLPRVYWLNFVSVEPGVRATTPELAAEAERVQERPVCATARSTCTTSWATTSRTASGHSGGRSSGTP